MVSLIVRKTWVNIYFWIFAWGMNIELAFLQNILKLIFDWFLVFISEYLNIIWKLLIHLEEDITDHCQRVEIGYYNMYQILHSPFFIEDKVLMVLKI